MLSGLYALEGRISPREKIYEAGRAALRIGHAQAMIANLSLAEMPEERADAWYAEQIVWTERLDKAIAGTALGKLHLAKFAADAIADTKQANLIYKLND